MMFLDCPAYLNPGGAVRCGLPAEVHHTRLHHPYHQVVAGHAGAVMPGSYPDPGRPVGPVLVTRASGTIGRRLVPALVAAAADAQVRRSSKRTVGGDTAGYCA
jgi:hypothetical protein